MILITGTMLRDAVISAANNITNNKQAVDELNVFPVPDGDTGTNMSMTFTSAMQAVSTLKEDKPIGEVAEITASALLRGARGNSGVILSLIFRGFAKGLKGLETASGEDIAAAFQRGVDAAYKAVMKPTEGTILTVVRFAAEKAKEYKELSAIEVWEKACEGAEDALSQTPEMLPVLKSSGVVDAGGQGLVLILLGMKSVFSDNTIIPSQTALFEGKTQVVAATGPAVASDDIKYGYCTEYIVQRNKKLNLDPARLRAYLESIGDSVVVVDDDNIIKVHAHSNDPGNVIQAGLKHGALVNIKIDNMREQHKNIVISHETTQEAPVRKVQPQKEFGMVAVAAGDGLIQLMQELGVDQMVKGGQTMNPSTQDILAAIEATPAKHVFVFPNNKNIIMAAEQTMNLADCKVTVIPTKTIPQGITALLNFDPSLSAKENQINMQKAIENINTAQVTFAARDSEVDGKRIKQGQIMGMKNGKITTIGNELEDVALKITKQLTSRTTELITIIYGEGVTQEQAEALEEQMQKRFGSSADISLINGGQPVYYYIISVE